MIIAHTEDSLQIVARTDNTLSETEQGTVAAVYFKPSVGKDTQISRHKAVEQNNGTMLKHD